MSEASPELVVTNAGLAVASVANPEGPFIHIVGMRIGSSFGYTPDRSQQGLRGTTLFSGAVTSWQSIGDNTLDIVITIPPEAGPFQFGEVGLYLADSAGVFSTDSVLFAIAAFDDLQTKFSSLGTNVISSYTFHCLLKLEQSVAVFQIDTSGAPPSVVDVYQWSDIYPPSVSANPDLPMSLVKELNASGEASLLTNASDAQWTMVGAPYFQYKNPHNDSSTFNVANASTSWVEILLSELMTQDLTSLNRRFVLRTQDGFFRSVQSVVNGNASGGNPTLRFNLNVTNDGTYNNSPLINIPPVASKVTLYRDDMASMGKIYYEQIIDAPELAVLATPTVPGVATAGNGLIVDTPGHISGYGLLQGGNNTGRSLSSADDLNNNALPSGLYYAGGGPSGFPANVPTTYSANVWIHNTTAGGGGSDTTQIWFPWNSGANWSTWEPFSVANKQGAVAGLASAYARSNTVNITIPKAGVWTIIAWSRAMQNAWNGGQLYINGVLVDQNTVYGDQQGIAYGIMHGQTQVSASAGNVFTVQANWSGLSPGPDESTQVLAYQVS
jgi:hypothetical protein